MFTVITMSYLALVCMTLYSLNKYKKLSETRITIRDDFFEFYVQYSILTFLMYLVVGSTFYLDKVIV